LQAAGADAMVVAAYGLILPQWVLDVPTWGASTSTPRCCRAGAGAAPIHRAIEAGDTETGITIMQMDAGLDTGDMLMAHTLPITGK
jgi:methionyl-tRNA formyltransferase